MLPKTLSAWLLPAVAIVAAATEFQPQGYVPRPLNDTIEALGLEEMVKDLPNFEDEKRDLSTRCSVACNMLRHLYSSSVQMPGTSAYTSNKASYWAQQQSVLSPTCFFAVKTERSIAVALVISQRTRCPFAVRSGGHSDVPGASNSPDGISIDLRAFNKVEVSTDKKSALVGPGVTWAEVYQELDQHEVTVVGGRAATVGVGGLTLGGGMSYISGRGGFACDNVLKFRVMMADGQVLSVTYQSHPLLYFALRGGGNNFGVVLEFQFETYAIKNLWGGIRVYPIEAKEAINAGLASYNDNASNDGDLAVITTFMKRAGRYFSTVIFDYAKPQANPPIMTSNFQDLLTFPPMSDTTRITNMTELALELGRGTPAGLRQQFTTVTYKNDAEIQNFMVDVFMDEVQQLESQVSSPVGFFPIVAFQPIPPTISSKFLKRGGNALGVKPTDGPLILVNLCFQWSQSADDHVVLPAIDRVISRTNVLAAQKGLLHPYIYMNYAAPNQKPVTSYGAANVAKLRQAQNVYDPHKVFERLQPGGFKLNM